MCCRYLLPLPSLDTSVLANFKVKPVEFFNEAHSNLKMAGPFDNLGLTLLSKKSLRFMINAHQIRPSIFH